MQKKKSAGRKGASKKRKPKSGVAASTMTVDGQKFKKLVCSLPKTEAKKRAEGVRKRGHKARVVKQGKTYCVFQGAKSKVHRARV